MRDAVLESRRIASNERVKKHREEKKQLRTSSTKAEIYRSKQSLGKAVKKASNALPKSPRKKKVVLANAAIFCSKYRINS